MRFPRREIVSVAGLSVLFLLAGWAPAGMALSLVAVTAVTLVQLPVRLPKRVARGEAPAALAADMPPAGLLARERFLRDLDRAAGMGSPVAVHAIHIRSVQRGRTRTADVLSAIARRLRQAGPANTLIAQLDPDVFAVAEIVRHPRQPSRTGRSITTALSQPLRLPGGTVPLEVCVGSALAPIHGADGDALLASAWTALGHARTLGPGARSLFRAGMEAEAQTREALRARIRRALSDESFVLLFQPVRRASDARLAGFEALLRLPRGDGGDLSPAIFLPVAEELGLTRAIGAWVLRQACATAAAWPAKLSIAVNLSAAQFEDERLASTVAAVLEASGLAPERLQLEVTELLLLANNAAVMRQLAELKALGVRIVLDDFGTGTSSLTTLWKTRFDRLKIDRALTRRVEREAGRSAVASVVALAHALRMEVTAEGVETAAQADLLVGAGCDLLQGFHYGRPLPAARVAGVILEDFRSALPARARAAEHARKA